LKLFLTPPQWRGFCIQKKNRSYNRFCTKEYKALTPKAAPDTAYALSGVFSCVIYKFEYE
ncbi:hypothetical protein, partial [Phascolarctobacterium succinatutens]|uniref:hypothetical protein n=1 Tax=Phascolarctobacterium succinatutens TaxID=626940 RepID=UPI00307857C7